MIIVLNLVLLRQRARFINADLWNKEDVLRYREMEMLNVTFRQGTKERPSLRDSLPELETLLANWRYYTKLQPKMACYQNGKIEHLSPIRFIVLREVRGKSEIIWRVTLKTEEGACCFEFFGPDGGVQRVYRKMVYLHNGLPYGGLLGWPI
jgi:hypothetical protein